MAWPPGLSSAAATFLALALALAMPAAALAGTASTGGPAFPGDALDADERVLRPDTDVMADGFVPGPGSDGATGDLYRLLADGDPGGRSGDATFITATGGTGTYRAAFEAAPSGVVTGSTVAVRVRASGGSVDLRVTLLDGQQEVVTGSVLRLDPAADGAWLDLEERFPGAVISSAAALRAEVTVTVPEGSAGRVDVASLAIRARLAVSLRPVESGLVGGARMTALAWGRSGSLVVGTAGGGLWRSIGPGRPFRARNVALTEPDWMRIASVVAHPGQPGTVYAAAGDRGERSALLRSTDDGRTWRVLSGQPSFSATALPGQADAALPIGTLLAVADRPDGTTIWAATVHDGLMRSTDGGASWLSLGLSGPSLVGLAMDPDAPGTLWLAARGSGVWRVTGAGTDRPVFRAIPGGPRDAEELAWVGDELLVVGGAEGVFRLQDDALVPANDGVPLDGSRWSTVAGVVVSGTRVAFAGCGPCTPGPDGTTVGLLRSIDGGQWQPVTDPATVGTDIAGTESRWQLSEALAGQAPGGPSFVTRHLLVRSVRGDGSLTASPGPVPADRASPSPSDPGVRPAASPAAGMASEPPDPPSSPAPTAPGEPTPDPSAPSPVPTTVPPVAVPVEVLVAADGAVWRSPDGGASWAPMVDGLGGRSMRAVVADPDARGALLVSAAGIGSIVSGDRLRTLAVLPWTGDDLPSMRTPIAMDVAFEGPTDDPARVVVAVGDAAREPAGEVLLGAALVSGGWTTTGYTREVPGTRPVAVAAGRDAAGARVLLAAAHPAGGIVRRVGEGPWRRSDSGEALGDPDGMARADLAWVPGSQVVYLFDPATGIHRSVDAGATWSLVWATRTNRTSSGRLAVGSDPTVVYVSTNLGVVRLEGADTGTVEDGSVRTVPIGTFRKPGPIVLDRHGRLWVASGVLPGSPARLSVTWDPAEPDPTFHDLADERYANTVTDPDSLAVLPDGSVVVADDLAGSQVLAPARLVLAPWLPADIRLDPLDRDEGTPMALQVPDPDLIGALVDPFEVVVASDGDDTASGTPDQPVATLEGAQRLLAARFGAAAERLDRDVRVLVRSGRYEGQRTRWTFTHAEHVVRIEGVPSGTSSAKPLFVGCVPGSCASFRPWFELAATPGAPTNLQLVNLQAALYHRGVNLAGGNPETGWNGRNVLHRLDLVNIGTRYRDDITPEVWSPGVFLLQASRDTHIVDNRVWHSANRMRHANGWFHTVYASHGSTGTVVRGNLVVDTSGDFHVRNGSDGGEFRGNVLVSSFLGAIVTEWSAADETDVCDTRVMGNLVLGDWDGGVAMVPWHRETTSPDGRCAATGLPDVTTADNVVLWPGLARR